MTLLLHEVCFYYHVAHLLSQIVFELASFLFAWGRGSVEVVLIDLSGY